MHFLRRIVVVVVVAASPQAHSAHHLRMRARLMNTHRHTHIGRHTCLQQLPTTCHTTAAAAASNVLIAQSLKRQSTRGHWQAQSTSQPASQLTSHSASLLLYLPLSLLLFRIARDKSQCLHLRRVGFPLIAQVWVMSPLSPSLSFCPFPLPPPTAFRVMPDSGSSACSYLRHRPLCSSCPLHAGVCFLLARALCPLHAHRAACGLFEGVRGGHWGCLWAISRQKFHELISVLHVVIY